MSGEWMSGHTDNTDIHVFCIHHFSYDHTGEQKRGVPVSPHTSA